MIKFQNISKIYNHGVNKFIALDNINLEIKPKEFVSVAGQSGAGKTTLLRLLIAEEKPTEGKIIFNNQNIHLLRGNQLPFLRRRIGIIFQDFRLLSDKTAYENVAFAMEVNGSAEEEIKRDVPQVLELVGLTDRAGHFPVHLSGGEKQRVAIARALIHRPEVIFADEPTGNLDLLNTWDIIRLLIKINELDTTVILASHDREIINNLGKRVVTMEKGKIIKDEENGKYIL